eukprot:425130_1
MPNRVYSIACVEEEWNFCPTGNNVVSGQSINEGSPEATWCLGNGRDRIGSTYLRALYREFETNCFDEQKDAPYHDGSTDGDIWKARDSMVDDSPSSQMWIYHSHVDEPRDVMTGLLCVIIITKEDKDHEKYDLRLEDVDREFVTFFVLFYENESHLMDKNLGNYLRFSSTDGGADALLKHDEFYESNLMHSISGYLDCDKTTMFVGTLHHLVTNWTVLFHHIGMDILRWMHNDTIALIGGTTKDVTMKVAII